MKTEWTSLQNEKWRQELLADEADNAGEMPGQYNIAFQHFQCVHDFQHFFQHHGWNAFYPSD